MRIALVMTLISLVPTLTACSLVAENLQARVKTVQQERARHSASTGTSQLANQSANLITNKVEQVKLLLGAKSYMGIVPSNGTASPNSLDAIKKASADLLQGKGPINAKALGSLANLARLYNQKDGSHEQAQSIPGGQPLTSQLAFWQKFIGDQAADTTAFTFEMQGKYPEAAEMTRKRLTTLEASNTDHSKDQILAQGYYKYSLLLMKMGRQSEAGQMSMRAHDLAPKDY